MAYSQQPRSPQECLCGRAIRRLFSLIKIDLADEEGVSRPMDLAQLYPQSKLGTTKWKITLVFST
ncbi:MAG: hypothetical protein CBC48_11100 [bacterium TMED88]|nr:hypothetical protein [Deltaproteobacteria bacterium]OUV29983.1 MAG: hypothetical protein CBC48_11100 [bacterium TMED88]